MPLMVAERVRRFLSTVTVPSAERPSDSNRPALEDAARPRRSRSVTDPDAEADTDTDAEKESAFAFVAEEETAPARRRAAAASWATNPAAARTTETESFIGTARVGCLRPPWRSRRNLRYGFSRVSQRGSQA